MAWEPVPEDVSNAAAEGGTVDERAGVPVWTVVPYAVTAGGMHGVVAAAEVVREAWQPPPEGQTRAAVAACTSHTPHTSANPGDVPASTESSTAPGPTGSGPVRADPAAAQDDLAALVAAAVAEVEARSEAGTHCRRGEVELTAQSAPDDREGGSTVAAGWVALVQADDDDEAPDPTLELLGHRRPDFPDEAFAPIPTFVAGQPPDIDPAVAEAVFRPPESPAAHAFHDAPPQLLRRPFFDEPRTVLPPLTLPEAVVPEAVVPEAVVPEAVVPEERLRVLPPPADGVAVVHVVGMRKRCYRCGDETLVIAGLLAHDPTAEPIDDRVPTAGWRRRNADVGPRYRYVRVSGVVELLASALESSWYEARGVAPLARREREASLQFTGEVVELANGCSVCDALLRSEPIEDAFENLVANTRHYDEYVLDTISVPAADLEGAPAW